MAKRLFYYITGFTIGAIFIYFLLMRGRSFNFWMPGERVKTEIIERKPVIADKALCQLACLNLNKDSIVSVIKKAEVNFDKSRVREKPCKYYLLEIAEENIQMEFSLCDTVVMLNAVSREGQGCSCN
ncbi:MAG: hypothetical protein POELPBGB_02851 [Bacteroidia bacterium]|nr:hypothetical protein [Bacteroidia bacterium]